MPTVIDIQSAVVSYREVMALRGISLQVESGEFIGIIGPNGAGKTTLLTLIDGLGKLQSGRVKVLGTLLTRGGQHSIRKKIGYVFQVENIDRRMPMSVHDFVMMGRYGLLGLLNRPAQLDRNIVDEALALTGLSQLAQRPIGHLSGGEQQRAAIARCLAQEPELFLLDEPTVSLDWKAKTEILALIKQIHDSRKLTTLIVTHDLAALPRACDRVVLMKDGLIYSADSPEKALTDENLSRLYDMPLSEVKERRQEVSLI